ncbi:MAG: hypothetical protein D3924_18340, partial [Candidatus Electrothrix sp. AR4]|nr:hypothetical protein [Candidatus Electrothrix sp. AR4]
MANSNGFKIFYVFSLTQLIGCLFIAPPVVDAAEITADQITAGVAQSYGSTTINKDGGGTLTFDTTDSGNTSTGADIIFDGTVYSTSAGTTGMLVDSGTAGTITFTNEIGDSGQLLSITTSGFLTDIASSGGEVDCLEHTYNTPVISGTSPGSSAIQEMIFRSRKAGGGNISFNDTLDAGPGHRRLRSITEGTTSFGG